MVYRAKDREETLLELLMCMYKFAPPSKKGYMYGLDYTGKLNTMTKS